MITPRFVVYIAILIITFSFGFKQWKKLSLEYKTIVVLVLLVTISEVISRITSYKIGTSNPSYHILICVYFFIYNWFYRIKLQSSIIQFTFLGSLLYSIVNIFVDSWYSFPSVPFITLSFIVVLSSLLALRKLLLKVDDRHILTIPDFWFNTANILFFSLTFFVLGMRNINPKLLPEWTFDIIFYSNIVLYCSYFAAIYFDQRINKGLDE